MKNKMILIVFLIVISLFVSCKQEDNTIYQFNSTDSISEWISPDGVHYWFYSVVNQAGLAPRYDNNGNLVIDRN